MKKLSILLTVLLATTAQAASFCRDEGSVKKANCLHFSKNVFKNGFGTLEEKLDGVVVSSKSYHSLYTENEGRFISMRENDEARVPTYKIELDQINNRYILKSIVGTENAPAGSVFTLDLDEYSGGLVPICLVDPMACS